jgi:CO/xanthine dehydrogenase FAD-binding subunit
MPTVCHDTLDQPSTLQEALGLLAAAPAGGIKALAGGTDLFANRAIGRRFLDLSKLTCLNDAYIVHGQRPYLRLGASYSWAQCQTDQLQRLAGRQAGFDALSLAAREIGGQQIQERGTLVGNICNASPAADGVPVLLSLGAQVECVSLRGDRVLCLEDFVLGPRRTALANDELVVALRIPLCASQLHCASHFQKLGARASLLISIAMVSVWMACETVAGKTNLVDIRIAVGSCSPVAMRLKRLESQLTGLELQVAKSVVLNSTWKDELLMLTPLDDVRASAEYRVHAAGILLSRSLICAMEKCG